MANMNPEEVAAFLSNELDKERMLREDAEAANRALIEEFSKAGTMDEVLEVAQKGIKDLLPIAIATMRNLLTSSDSDSVRAGLSKYVTDTVLTHKVEGEGNKEIRDLIAGLAANDPAPTPVNND